MLSSGNTVNAITTTVTGSSTNLQIPTAKAVADYVTSGASTIIQDGDSRVFVKDNTATPINFTINGSSSMVIDQNGNVGIGTISPSQKFDVYGGINIGGGGDSYFDGNVGVGVLSPGEAIDVSGTVRATIFSGSGASLTNLPTAAPAGSDKQIQYNNSGVQAGAARFAYDVSSGNVGIGSIAPRAKLEIVASGTTTGTAFQIDDSLYAPKFTVLDNGNVGIGTVTADTKLRVEGGDVALGPAATTYASNSEDLFVKGNIELDGKLYGDGSGLTNLSGSGWTKSAGVVYTTTSGDSVGIGTTAPLSTLDLQGGLILKRTARTADYTVTANDYLIAYTALAAQRTVTLPNALCQNGRMFVIKDESGNAAVNNIVIDPEGATTVNGAATFAVDSPYNSVDVYCGDGAWYIR